MNNTNQGILDTNEVFARALSNTWPTPSISTSDILEGSNLYYTNTRVKTYVESLSTDLSSNTTTDLAEGNNLYYTNARVSAHLAENDVTVGGNLNVNGSLDTPSFSVSNTLTVGSQLIYAQGTNGFSVNEDFDPSSNSLQTAYHFTSGAGRETVAFTLARTGQFTNGFGIRGTSADNKMVNFGEQNNTSFEWRKGVGIQPLNLGGGTLLANIQPNGDMYILGNVRAYQYLDSTGTIVGSSIDLSGNTTTDLAEGTNLYYTNARVQAYVGSLSTNLSGNTTTDLAEGTNLYYTNSRARTAYTAGSGILIFNGEISADVNIPREQTFDVTVDNTVFYSVTDSLESAFTVSSSSLQRHILKSLILTNISESTATVNANIVYANTEYVFANTLSIPYGYSIDLKFNPEIIMPGTSYKFQASANDTVSLYATYKTVEDISFVSKTTALTADTYATIYDSNDADIIIESIKIMNHEGTNLRGTLQVRDSSDAVVSYLAANTLLAANYASELLEHAVRLPLGYKLSFIQFSGRGTAIVSGRKSEAYIITSNVETISEGQSVTFAITSVNVPDGATRYFRTLGNVSSSDFVEGNTGSFTVVDDSSSITLTANADVSYGDSEAGEQFKIVIAKTSITSSAVGLSNVINIIDTSNSTGISSLSVSSNLIYGSEAVTLGITTIHGEGNNAATFYYTITGNAAIYSNTSGAIIINDNAANLEIIAEAVDAPGEERVFAVQFRTDSVSGTIRETSETIYVLDAASAGVSATGGDEVITIDI